MLGFSPNRFFNELERADRYSEKTLRNSFYRAQREGLISTGSKPKLTSLGKQRVRPFVAEKLQSKAALMVIFDIPRSDNHLRRSFRNELRHLGFRQLQQSVWISSYDHRHTIKMIVNALHLEDCVQMYEVARV